MTNALTIFIQIKLNLEHQMTKKWKTILCILKKDVDYLSILKKSMTSQKINSKSDLVNDLIEKLLNILPILKK